MTSLAAGWGCSIRFSPRRDAPLGMSVSPPSFVQPRQRCTAHQTQQKIEGEIKAARQLFKRARVNLSDRLVYYAAAAAAGAPQVEPASLIRHGCFRLVAKGNARPRRLFLDSVVG